MFLQRLPFTKIPSMHPCFTNLHLTLCCVVFSQRSIHFVVTGIRLINCDGIPVMPMFLEQPLEIKPCGYGMLGRLNLLLVLLRKVEFARKLDYFSATNDITCDMKCSFYKTVTCVPVSSTCSVICNWRTWSS